MAHQQQPAAWLGALEGSREATLVVDEGIRVAYASPALRRLFEVADGAATPAGLLPGELVGCVEAVRPGGCGAQEACHFCGVRRSALLAIEGREVHQQPIRMVLRRGLGTPRELELRVSARLAPGAGPRHGILVLEPKPAITELEQTQLARDVTERRLGEQALRETEDRLRQSQKMEAIGRLAGGVAHDFNNMLTVILSSADLGLLVSGGDQGVRVELEEIRAAGLRAQALTRQLLAFSRRQVLQPQVVDLNARVRDLEQLLARLLGEEIEVRSRLAPDLQRVVIDPSQLEQVILNLAVNARDAMPMGGTLSVETANVVLDETYAARHVGATTGPQVLLAISDTGTGMDVETTARIFEPFFTTKPKGKGTGLGLSTVYGIVKQSGGSIWVYSEPGQGTTFKVYLPRAPDAGEVTPTGSRPGKLRARPGESLLVVEDDDQVRRTAVRCLEALGYLVTSAHGLEEAVRLVDDGLRFTVLLTDVIMPGGNGVEVAKALGARRPSMGLVFMSGYTDDAISQHGVLSPGALFLEKPFTQETLGRKVREAMDLVAAPSPS